MQGHDNIAGLQRQAEAGHVQDLRESGTLPGWELLQEHQEEVPGVVRVVRGRQVNLSRDLFLRFAYDAYCSFNRETILLLKKFYSRILPCFVSKLGLKFLKTCKYNTLLMNIVFIFIFAQAVFRRCWSFLSRFYGSI